MQKSLGYRKALLIQHSLSDLRQAIWCLEHCHYNDVAIDDILVCRTYCEMAAHEAAAFPTSPAKES